MAENKKQKKKMGRPQRYPNETSQRLSVMIRPRYKKALEMISKHRGISLSEATELALSFFAQEYRIDDEPLINYVRPVNERFLAFVEAIELRSIYSNFKDKDNAIEKYESIINSPLSLRTPVENYFVECIENVHRSYRNLTKEMVFHYYNFNRLFERVSEDWKEGGLNYMDTSVMLSEILIEVINEHFYFYFLASADNEDKSPLWLLNAIREFGPISCPNSHRFGNIDYIKTFFSSWDEKSNTGRVVGKNGYPRPANILYIHPDWLIKLSSTPE